MAAIREFGKVLAKKNYVLRPGGYGIVRDAAGRVAVVATSRGAFLLGGAQEGRETPRQALIREALEECGCSLQVGKRIAVADEMLFAKKEKSYFRKRCTFFAAKVLEQDTALACESDHTLVWLSAKEARHRLVHESHRWALWRATQASTKTEANRAPEPTSSTSSRQATTSVMPPRGRLRKASPGETQEARQP